MTKSSSPARKYAAGLTRPFRLKKSQATCSSKRIRTVIVGALGAGEAPALDQEPDAADDRHQRNQRPPARFVAIMPALRVEREYEVQRRQDVENVDIAIGQLADLGAQHIVHDHGDD